MSTAIVTGANGFLGSRLVRRLAESGMTVRALVRRPEAAAGLTGAEVLTAEVTDLATLRAAMAGADLVVHTVAAAGPDMETSLRINGEGTRTVAEAALAAGVGRMVHISSQSVYDFAVEQHMTEATPWRATGSPYDMGKQASELAVQAVAARGLKAAILRPTMVLGAHPTSSWGVKIPLAMKEGRFKLYGEGEATFPYIHVENLIDLILLAATREAAVGRVYNANDGHTTWRGYAGRLARELGFPLPESIPIEQAPPFFRWTGTHSSARAQQELGYSPRLSFDDAIAETIAYFG